MQLPIDIDMTMIGALRLFVHFVIELRPQPYFIIDGRDISATLSSDAPSCNILS